MSMSDLKINDPGLSPPYAGLSVKDLLDNASELKFTSYCESTQKNSLFYTGCTIDVNSALREKLDAIQSKLSKVIELAEVWMISGMKRGNRKSKLGKKGKKGKKTKSTV